MCSWFLRCGPSSGSSVRTTGKIVWAAILMSLVIRAPACDTTGREPVIDRNRIAVWTCEIPGQPLRGFKAVTRVHSSLAGLVGLLMDADAAPQWIYRTERIQLLKRDDSARTFTVRAETNFWPLADRDVVVDGRISQNAETLAIIIDSRSIEFPQHKDFVRMPGMWGRWEFRPQDDGEVAVVMTGHADPGGHIPGFLVNLLVQEMPYRTLLGLQRMILAPKYQQSRFDGIREPQS